jgi:DNA invertase Pin-like site-specific DNA recombinase
MGNRCVIREQVSGNAADADRAGIERAMELARAGSIRKVLVHEVSRVARRKSTAHRFVEDLEACEVSLYWHAQRIETLLPSGKRKPAASIMFSLLAEMARNERDTLVERIKSGLEEARRKGHTLGRPAGSVQTRDEMLAKHRDVVRHLRAGHSIRHTAKITGKGGSTVQRVKAAMVTD